MTEAQTERMVGLDRDVRNLIAHEGYSERVQSMLTELEALALLWVDRADKRYSERLQARAGER